MKVNQEEFIKRSNEKHDFKYDYSKSIFNRTSDKVLIICKIHGEFSQRVDAHFSGQGCPNCNKSKPLISRYLNFINRSKEIHHNKYNYSLVEYTNTNDLVKIICPTHGIFEQRPKLHISGHGCKRCSNSKKISDKSKGRKVKKRIILEQWIERSNIKHNYMYDYSLIKEIESDRYHKVPIKCKNGHIFYTTIKDHLGSPKRKGNGCKYCSMPCSDKESFIRLSNERHGNKYDYSKVEYNTQRDKVIITCRRHGDFIQKVSNHIHLGRGCRRCGESKGELEIRKWLESKNILFEKEKTFENCGNRRLRFDFYLPEYNTCIEFDGLQHFKSIEQFGGNEEFEKTKKRDITKNKYCEEVGINLIRVSYINLQKENIYSILDSHINIETL